MMIMNWGAYQNWYIAKIVEIAAEQRQRIAHGVRRGNRAKKSSSSGWGERKRLWRAFAAPRLVSLNPFNPKAHAVGYHLTPLRG